MEKDELNQLLNEWRIESSSPANFSSEVWRRIEKKQPFNVTAWISDWLGNFTKPLVACSYIAVAVGVGLVAGQVHATRDVQSAESAAKARYIQAVDPYANPPLR